MSRPEHPVHPEDLLELVLSRDPGLSEEREAARSAPDTGARFRKLEGWVETCRAACPAVLDERDADEALVAAILERTTREDLGWRGDVGLLRRFVRARWRSSVALRLAAASLLLHLLALPVLAFLVLRGESRDRSFVTGVEPRETQLPQPLEEPERDLEYPEGFEGSEPLLVDAPDRLAVENARRRERLVLELQVGPGAAYAPDAPVPAGVETLLEARARLLAGEPSEIEFAGPLDDVLERALWLDLSLDLWLLGRAPAPDLELFEAPTPRSDEDPAAWLLAAARERAAACGVQAAGYPGTPDPMSGASDRAASASENRTAPAASASLSPTWARELRAALSTRTGPAAELWSRWAEARSAQ